MTVRTYYQFLVFFALFFLLGTLHAQTNVGDRTESAKNSTELTVALTGEPPFVFESVDELMPKGIAVELWNEIASEGGLEFKYVRVPSVIDALDSIQKRKSHYDVVVGPIGITSANFELVDFSQPFSNSGVSIVTTSVEKTLWSYVKTFFNIKLIYYILSFLLGLSIAGMLIWLVERKTNSDFPPAFFKGVGTGVWFVLVTMGTVGYGEIVVRTVMGRILSSLVIVFVLISATSLVAGIAHTVSSLDSETTVTRIEELGTKKIAATIEGSSSEEFAKSQGLSTVKSVKTLDAAMQMLENDEVDAVIYNRPELQSYIFNNPGPSWVLENVQYDKHGFGFAFPKGSKLVEQVDIQLLKLEEAGTAQKIINSYLGSEN